MFTLYFGELINEIKGFFALRYFINTLFHSIHEIIITIMAIIIRKPFWIIISGNLFTNLSILRNVMRNIIYSYCVFVELIINANAFVVSPSVVLYRKFVFYGVYFLLNQKENSHVALYLF